MSGMTFDDLVDEAGAAAEQTQTGGKSTGEWFAETMQLLDSRGLLEPMLFGPEGAAEVREQMQRDADAAVSDDDRGHEGGGFTLDADGIVTAADALEAHFGEGVTVGEVAESVNNIAEGIEAQLGEGVTVGEVAEIAEANPELVNKKLAEGL